MATSQKLKPHSPLSRSEYVEPCWQFSMEMTHVDVLNFILSCNILLGCTHNLLQHTGTPVVFISHHKKFFSSHRNWPGIKFISFIDYKPCFSHSSNMPKNSNYKNIYKHYLQLLWFHQDAHYLSYTLWVSVISVMLLNKCTRYLVAHDYQLYRQAES